MQSSKLLSGNRERLRARKTQSKSPSRFSFTRQSPSAFTDEETIAPIFFHSHHQLEFEVTLQIY